MAEICKQIHAEVEDKVGKLAEVTDKLTAAGVNILAAVAWTQDGRGHLIMVTDDNEKACQAIGAVVDRCELEEAVRLTLPNEIGALGKVAHKLADEGISIKLVYASAVGAELMIVLETSDNAKAAELI